MDRRVFLRRASLVAAGVVAGDQLELLDRLGWTRTLFPSALMRETLWGDGMHDDTPGLTALVNGKEVFDHRRNAIIPAAARGAPGLVYIRNGYYKLASTVHVDATKGLPRRTHFESCVFEGWHGYPLFHFGPTLPPVNNFSFSHVWIENNNGLSADVNLSTVGG